MLVVAKCRICWITEINAICYYNIYNIIYIPYYICVKSLFDKKLSYRRGTASCQLKSCQLPCNSAETTYTTSPDQIDGMKLEI